MHRPVEKGSVLPIRGAGGLEKHVNAAARQLEEAVYRVRITDAFGEQTRKDGLCLPEGCPDFMDCSIGVRLCFHRGQHPVDPVKICRNIGRELFFGGHEPGEGAEEPRVPEDDFRIQFVKGIIFGMPEGMSARCGRRPGCRSCFQTGIDMIGDMTAEKRLVRAAADPAEAELCIRDGFRSNGAEPVLPFETCRTDIYRIGTPRADQVGI